MKTVSRVLLILAAAIPAFATGPAWDSTGNNLLNGTYYFRQVIYQSSGGSLSGAYSYYGNISFNGSGTYSITAATFVQYTSSGPQVNTAATATGTYSVSASGYGFMSSPVITGVNIVFLVSNGIIVGSETENTQSVNDMFVAAPYSTSLGLSSLSGTYTIASMFPSADATYQFSPNGTAILPGTLSISGYSTSGSTATQSSSGIKIAYSNGAYAISFPNNTSANFYSGGTLNNGGTGSLFLYSSPDSNFVFGGTQYGYDMFVGVRNVSSGTSTPLSGLYYEAGIDNNSSSGLDTYYGTFNAFQGSIIGHERLISAGYTPEGLTYYNNYPASISGSYTDSSNTVNYTVGVAKTGQNGIRIGYGTAGLPAIEVALPYTPPTVTQSIYLDPTGIVNTASSAPYTAGVSPGDFITIYNGVGLANSTTFAPPGAFPTSLGGVSVLVDGISAPIYYVSPTQISFLVPYEICPASPCTFPIASIQVNNNGLKSNIATTYVNLTTPGVFTANPVGGDGIAAMIDFPASGGYFIVSANNPANPGDAVALYLTGLGAPFPTNGDGALGPATGDSLVQTINVDVNGISVGTPGYLGLAPTLAGLYQINFNIPTLCTVSGQTGCINSGNNSIGISGPDSYSSESYIPVSSGGTTALRTSQTSSVVRKTTLPRLSNSGNR
jgi:uncharacterized protein (TIGR03437 family)